MGNKLDTQKTIKSTYNKEMLINNIAETCGKSVNTVRTIYNTLEEIIAKLLSSATPNNDVSIRLFRGISIDSTFVPEKTKVNNLTGEIITSTSKIKPKANITRDYRDKITAYSK